MGRLVEHEFITVRWTPPAGGWYKLNTDGSVKGPHKNTGAGGVIRDSDGNWVIGFAKNLGLMTIFQAELWALYQGLELAIELNITDLEIDIDAKSVVEAVLNNDFQGGLNLNLISKCRLLIGRFRHVKLSHIYREANSVADHLAKYGADCCNNFARFDRPPDFVSTSVIKDVAGFVHFRTK